MELPTVYISPYTSCAAVTLEFHCSWSIPLYSPSYALRLRWAQRRDLHCEGFDEDRLGDVKYESLSYEPGSQFRQGGSTLALRKQGCLGALQKAFDFFSCILPYVFLTEKNQASACNQEMNFWGRKLLIRIIEKLVSPTIIYPILCFHKSFYSVLLSSLECRFQHNGNIYMN